MLTEDDSLHQRLVPSVSCDDLYRSRKGVFSRDEWSEEERAESFTLLVLGEGLHVSG